MPAAATFTFHRQGATVKTTTMLLPADPPDDRDIPVDDIGLIAIGDLILLGASGPQYEVTNLIGRTKVRIRYTGTGSYQLPANTRLFAPTVQAYRDARGSQPLTPPYSSDSTTGRFGAYIGAPRFDFIVTGSGFSPRTYLDYDGGPSVSALGWLLSRDFVSLEAAIEACPDHQETTVVLEPIPYLRSDTLVLPPNKRVRLMGAGRGLTVLTCTDVDKPAVWIKNSWCGLEALTVRGPGGAGLGAGVVIGRLASDQPAPPATADIIRYTRLNDVQVQYTPGWGIEVLGTDDPGCNADSLSIFGRFDGVTIEEPRSLGALRIGRGTTTQSFASCQFLHFVGHGILARRTEGLTLSHVTCESWSVAGAPAFAEFEDCRGVTVIGSWFEEQPFPAPESPRPWFVHVKGNESQGISLIGCSANRQPNPVVLPGTTPPPSYLSRAVLIEGRQTVIIDSLVTSTTDAPGSGQRREDIELRVDPLQNFKPTLVLTGGVARAGSSKLALDVVTPGGAGYAESSPANGIRAVASFQSTNAPAYDNNTILLLRAQGGFAAGSLVYNSTFSRFEYFDGTAWRFVLGTPVS